MFPHFIFFSQSYIIQTKQLLLENGGRYKKNNNNKQTTESLQHSPHSRYPAPDKKKRQ